MPRSARTAPLAITFPHAARPVRRLLETGFAVLGIQYRGTSVPRPPTWKDVFVADPRARDAPRRSLLIQSAMACLLHPRPRWVAANLAILEHHQGRHYTAHTIFGGGHFGFLVGHLIWRTFDLAGHIIETASRCGAICLARAAPLPPRNHHDRARRTSRNHMSNSSVGHR